MTNPSTIQVPFFILSTIISLLLLNQNVSTTKDGDLIKETCTKYTEFPDLCISTLEADPRSKTATNFTSLCRVAMEVVETQANEAVTFVNQFLANATDFINESAIEGCINLYLTDAMAINMIGLPAFDEKRYKDAYDSIGLAREGAAECNDHDLRMFDKLNDEFIKFTTIVMDLVNNLVTN